MFGREAILTESTFKYDGISETDLVQDAKRIIFNKTIAKNPFIIL
jgi:hypothetical protein